MQRDAIWVDQCTSHIPTAYGDMFGIAPSPVVHYIPVKYYYFLKTTKEHITRLRGVFEKLAKASLKLKSSKCEFFKWQRAYLGNIVQKIGLRQTLKRLRL